MAICSDIFDRHVNHLSQSPNQDPRPCCLNRLILDSVRVSTDLYSAAAASDSLGLTIAVDSMKSEIRGTISDLKREPLNTP
jgi:hypothetical protein